MMENILTNEMMQNIINNKYVLTKDIILNALNSEYELQNSNFIFLFLFTIICVVVYIILKNRLPLIRVIALAGIILFLGKQTYEAFR